MATRTENFELYKPEATDNFSDFMDEFNDNMDIIDENLGGGGGGSGGHTIIDENGQSMTQRTGLEFTGNVQVTDDSVNNKTIVEIVGDGSEDVELTIAEYIALPDTKLSDDKNYFIKDINNDNVLGYPPLIYSTDEREVGVWIDGKPLYQKTINCGTLPNSSNKSISTPNNLENLIDAFGFAYSLSDATNQRLVPFSAGGTNDIRVDLRNSIITITTFSNWSSYTGYLTIQYTKTTDTPGAGIWNGQGGIAHHYSTNETVIGTWYNGKPIYEKTYEFSSALLVEYSSWSNTTIDSSNIQTVIDARAWHSDGTSYGTIMADPTRSSHTLLGLQTTRNGSQANVKVLTIQYTKITD